MFMGKIRKFENVRSVRSKVHFFMLPMYDLEGIALRKPELRFYLKMGKDKLTIKEVKVV